MVRLPRFGDGRIAQIEHTTIENLWELHRASQQNRNGKARFDAQSQYCLAVFRFARSCFHTRVNKLSHRSGRCKWQSVELGLQPVFPRENKKRLSPSPVLARGRRTIPRARACSISANNIGREWVV